MKTKEQIEKELSRLEADDRLHCPSADIFTNAPLALVQIELESRVRMLRWVLAEESTVREAVR